MANTPKIVIKNLDTKLGWCLRRTANEIGTRIQDDFEKAITKFYMDYEPTWYDRTYSLYEGAVGVGGRGKYIKKSGKYGYDCGIEVGSEFYSYNPYVKDPHHGKEMSPDEVFPNAFEYGRHGFSSYTMRVVHKNQSKDAKWWRLKKKHIPKVSTPPIKSLNASFKQVDNSNYVFEKLYQAFEDAGAFIDIE